MCPNSETPDNQACPPSPFGKGEPPCRFVKVYVDNRGWKCKVMPGIGEGNYKTRYQKPEKSGSTGWKGVAALPWRKSFDEAQAVECLGFKFLA
ncbi:MAG TPA: hypothetical protein DCZ10_12150 [Pelotomaculum sp.]|nr:hypothetical protein [Pelotomaculum sp.]